MAEHDAAIGAGAGWATDAALDEALGDHRCPRCGDTETTCRAIGCWAGDDGDHDDDRRRNGAGRA